MHFSYSIVALSYLYYLQPTGREGPSARQPAPEDGGLRAQGPISKIEVITLLNQIERIVFCNGEVGSYWY